jgi:hypothetical protein
MMSDREQGSSMEFLLYKSSVRQQLGARVAKKRSSGRECKIIVVFCFKL